ncbi:hypothetical protein BCR42DRAFT_336677 [Absidia repens]|uniref:Uncharacterized protein n=1 Tax=Absidia repens TaxID=90262 RepID=A0A1X2I156_9FUNG|nr:hypothetical protein BCR42DRAFT_336677 [Absidia repens]
MVGVIANYIPKYQTHINCIKSQGYAIVGYARKTPGPEGKQRRNNLLNRMVYCLKKRSLCDKVFVSSSCLASDSLVSRDVNEEINVLGELTNVDVK